MDEIKQRILDFLGSEAERPLPLKELTTALEVPKEDRNRFKKRLKQLVDDGLVIKIRGDRYGVASKMKLVTGSLICHPDGYGFVRPEEGEGGTASEWDPHGTTPSLPRPGASSWTCPWSGSSRAAS